MKLSDNDLFEIKARLFFDDTGHMAPGKDDPLRVIYDPEAIYEAYAEWNAVNGKLIHRTLQIVQEILKDQTP